MRTRNAASRVNGKIDTPEKIVIKSIRIRKWNHGAKKNICLCQAMIQLSKTEILGPLSANMLNDRDGGAGEIEGERGIGTGREGERGGERERKKRGDGC